MPFASKSHSAHIHGPFQILAPMKRRLDVDEKDPQTEMGSRSKKVLRHYDFLSNGSKTKITNTLPPEGTSVAPLPEELLDRIVAELSGYQPTLANLCRSSRQLQRIALPHLYSTPYVYSGNYPVGMRSFLRALIRHPQLASRVTHIRVNQFSIFTTRWRRLRIPPPSVKDANLFKISARQTHFPQQYKWIWQLNSGDEDADLALILTQASNLTHLELRAVLPKRDYHIIPNLIHHASLRSHRRLSFANLTSITIGDFGEKGGQYYPLEYLPYFLSLPVLRQLQAKVRSAYDALQEPHSQLLASPRYPVVQVALPNWPIRTSPIESLKLESSVFLCGEAEQLFRAGKALKEFSFTFCSDEPQNPDDFHPEFRYICVHDLAEHLKLHSETLTTLEIDLRDHEKFLSKGLMWDLFGPFGGFFGPMDSLRKLKKLKNLSLSPQLFAWDPNGYPSADIYFDNVDITAFVPPYLESLTLFDGNHSVLEWLTERIEDNTLLEATPDLRSVSVVGWKSTTSQLDDLAKMRATEVFSAKNVRFDYHENRA